MYGFVPGTTVYGRGYVGSVPDVRETGSGKKVCSMNVKIGKDEASWVRVTTWQGLAVACGALKKGTPIYFEAHTRITQRGEDGNFKSYTDFVADKVGVFDRPDHFDLLVPVAASDLHVAAGAMVASYPGKSSVDDGSGDSESGGDDVKGGDQLPF